MTEVLPVQAQDTTDAPRPAVVPDKPALEGLEAKWAERTAEAQLPELTARFQAVAARLRERQGAVRVEAWVAARTLPPS